MGAFPTGLATKTLTFGRYSSVLGSNRAGTVRFGFDKPMLHVPTGEVVVAGDEAVTITADTGAAQVVVPITVTDDLVVDWDTVNPTTNQRLKVSILMPGYPPKTQYIDIHSDDPAVMDFDALRPYATPGGLPVMRSAVTSVAGLGGDVATEDLASELGTVFAPRSALPASGARAVGDGDLVYRLGQFGSIGSGDGLTDITEVIQHALTEIPMVDPTWGGAQGVLLLPPGRYVVADTLNLANRVTLRGSGRYSSVLYQDTGMADDMLVLGAYADLANLSVAGRRSNITSDLVVVNGSYASLEDVRISSAGRNGITIGKGGQALLTQLGRVNVRRCMGYGIEVVGASESTDGQWSRLDVGQCGLSGVKISNGAQNFSDLHSWGNGLESTTDNHGLWLNSQSNVGTNVQTETNLGSGIHLGSTGSGGHVLTGIKSWGNMGNGIRGFQSNRNQLSGAVYLNGVSNTAGASSASFAGVFNDGGVEWDMAALDIYDEPKTIPAGAYSGITPTYPFPGRATAVLTQSYGYAEGSGADYNRIGGIVRKERARTGIAVLNFGSHNNYDGAVLGESTPPNVAAAATVNLPAWMDYITVSGTTQITSIGAARVGRRVTLVFTDAAPGGILDGVGTVRLAGNFAPTQYGTITLVYSGSAWHETSRSAN